MTWANIGVHSSDVPAEVELLHMGIERHVYMTSLQYTVPVQIHESNLVPSGALLLTQSFIYSDQDMDKYNYTIDSYSKQSLIQVFILTTLNSNRL